MNKFSDGRDWRQFHNEKDLVISISMEISRKSKRIQLRTDQGRVSRCIDLFSYVGR